MEAISEWAQQEFGSVQVGDTRRTRRAVALARDLGQHPAASLPIACGAWSALKSSYRLLHAAGATREALSTPHWQHTRQAAGAAGVTLFISDLTELDYTTRTTLTDLGEIGDGRGRGFHVHTTLAYRPDEGAVLGVAAQQTFRRHPSPLTRAQRRARHEVESRVWTAAVTQIGPPPTGAQWVHVGDRAADIWTLFATCLQEGTDFVYRVNHRHRQVQLTATERLPVSHILTQIPFVSDRQVAIAQRGQRPARVAQVRIGAGPVTVPAPRSIGAEGTPLHLWLVVVQEVDPPPAVEAVEWLLWTSVPTTTAEQADRCIEWYHLRWLIEDYHQCLKTGCRMEERAMQKVDALERLLGILGPVAAYVLAVRHAARQTPQARAVSQQPEEVVRVVAHLARVPPAALTCQQFWHTVARRGGWLGRTRDGPPGWKTLWAGWQVIHTLVEGVHLAAEAVPIVQ
jgi:hypothetical protein